MKLNKRIITVMSAILTLFLVIVVYLTWFTFSDNSEVDEYKESVRKKEKESHVMRGKIYDRNGILLAENEIIEVPEKNEAGKVVDTQKVQRRKYPYKGLYAHTIGYVSKGGDKTGIEKSFDDELRKTRTEEFFDRRDEDGERIYQNGASLELTLDHGMTQLAAKLLEKNNEVGSIVAINPKTGEVYCLYSNPSFDPTPDALGEKFEALSNDPSKPFVFRAAESGYAPGSTFKMITATAGIEVGFGDFSVNDQGSTTIGGKTFKNTESQKSNGNIGMDDAVRVSSNVYFVELSQKIGIDKMKEVIESFYVTADIDFDIPTTDATDLRYNDMDAAKLAATSIGQGDLQISPLQMALAACAIANDGVIMQPYLVSKAYFEDDKVLGDERQPEELSVVTDKKTARKVRDYMVGCVEEKGGTAYNYARVEGIKIAGKTGTAQTGSGKKEHTWFIGMAPANDPQLVVCVMKEHSGGGGGSKCGEPAAEIIKYAMENGLIKY